MARKTFSTSLSAWARESSERMMAIAKQSAQAVASEAQSRIPVDTGFARASLTGSLAEMPLIAADDAEASQNENITLAIAKMREGDTLFLGYTASYVLPLEYGHSKQAPAGFVRLAAQRWPQIVDQVTEEARSRVNNG